MKHTPKPTQSNNVRQSRPAASTAAPQRPTPRHPSWEELLGRRWSAKPTAPITAWMGAISMAFMDPQWLKLRWPITVLVLGAMATALLMRSSRHPIQLRLVVSFSEPLSMSGKVQTELNMPKPMQVETSRSVQVQVTEQAPIDLSVRNTTPVQVQVSNPQPIDIQVDDGKPVPVDVDPKAPLDVKIGL